MNILHNKVTEGHNLGSNEEGPYRVMKFIETVTNKEVTVLLPTAQEQINNIHSLHYTQKVQRACNLKNYMAEVSLSPASYDAMMTSVSLAILAAQRNDFAITRPPGHHASREKAEGFCFFNNIAIATSYLLNTGKRVCIIDIDGHHGNGTQSIFSKDDRVLFCSIHQSGVYPQVDEPCNHAYGFRKKSKQTTDIGKGPSFKKVINIPLSSNSGDDLFLKSLEFLREYVERFNPDHIGISAGFDGYSKDNVLSLNYTKRGYYEAGKYLRSFSKPLFAVLEGGYHEDIRDCVESIISGISGEIFTSDEQLSVSSLECINKCFETLQNLSAKLNG